jgi:hypothetical protein
MVWECGMVVSGSEWSVRRAVVNLSLNFKDASKRKIYLLDERLPASVGVFCSLEVLRQTLKCLKQWKTNINYICFKVGEEYIHEIMFVYLAY